MGIIKILRYAVCIISGHVPAPLPCSDKRWNIFYCQRCEQMVADLTPLGVQDMLTEDADRDLALQGALGRGMAEAMIQSMDRLLLETFREVADSKVNPLIARAIAGEELLRSPAKVEIPVGKMVLDE